MGTLKKITSNVTYKVPAWDYCNCMDAMHLGRTSKKMCRFCAKEGKSYRCTLYNTYLYRNDTARLSKTYECSKATAGYKSVVEDVEDTTNISVDPKDVIKMTIAAYDKARKDLMNQGYPAVMADKLAKDYILGGM